MRGIRYLSILLLSMLMGVEVAAQDDFNPTSPGDPGVPPQKLILVAAPADGGSLSGGGKYVPETQVSVTANANTNWQFVNWTDEDGNVVSTDRSFKYTKGDKTETLIANFEFSPGSPADPVEGTQLVYYRLTPQAAHGGTVSGGGRYRCGTQVQLSAKCNEGFYFTGWVNEDGETVSESLTFTYTTNAFNETLTATFAFNPDSPQEPDVPKVRHLLNIEATEGGTVEGGGRIMEDTPTTLRARCNTGYKFVGWFIDGELVTSLPTFNYTMGTEDITIEARFEFDPDSPDDPATPMDKQYSIYLMSPITYPGRDVDCQVYLSNPYSPLKDMHFNLTFPEGLTPDVDNIKLNEDVEGYTASAVATDEPNVYTVTLLGGTVPPGNKEIFRIHVPIPETIAPGTDYQLKINQVSVTQEDNTTCTTGTRNGRISIYKKGDSNGDDEVNVTDVVNVLGYINTGIQEDTTLIFEVSNVSGDDLLNVTDIVGILEIINDNKE